MHCFRPEYVITYIIIIIRIVFRGNDVMTVVLETTRFNDDGPRADLFEYNRKPILIYNFNILSFHERTIQYYRLGFVRIKL